MRYTAANLTAAERPVVITIGRVGSGPLRWLSRQWIRRARTWTARPISTPQMLALQAAAKDPALYLMTLATVLRAVFPRRWWYGLVGDPLALILALPEALRQKVLQTLVTVPGAGRDESQVDDDPVEAIRRLQRVSVHGPDAARGPRPSLATVALTVRHEFGEAWYWNPQRWATADGYAPFALCWIEYVGLQALAARRRLEVADGYAIANAKDPRRARQPFEQAAYPSDVVS